MAQERTEAARIALANAEHATSVPQNHLAAWTCAEDALDAAQARACDADAERAERSHAAESCPHTRTWRRRRYARTSGSARHGARDTVAADRRRCGARRACRRSTYALPRADAEELLAEAACGRGGLAADKAWLDVLALVRLRVPARPTCCRREARLGGPSRGSAQVS
jgi:hypothetical protein